MKDALILVALSVLVVTLTVCMFLYFVPLAHAGPAQRCGTASWYQRGTITASGHPFRPDDLTAAMWGVPFGTRFRIIYRDKSVVVVINDRGPARRLRRIIDLSRGAARRIGLKGIGRVCLTRL